MPLHAPITESVGQLYREKGFAIAEALMGEDRISRASRAVERIQSDFSTLPPDLLENLVMERDLPAKKRGGLPSEEAGDAIFIIGDPPVFDPFFAELAIDPAIIDLIGELLGVERCSLRYHFSNVTMKRQRIGSGISWHRDFPNRYICPQRSSFLRIMICLDAMDRENGATQFIEGSHRISDAEALVAMAADAASALEARIMVAECGAGSVVFIHPKSVHGGTPNPSPRHRRNLVIQWGRADDPISVPPDSSETLAGFGIADIERWLAS